MRTKGGVLVEVPWDKHTVEGPTWEADDDMKSKYQFLCSIPENYA